MNNILTARLKVAFAAVAVLIIAVVFWTLVVTNEIRQMDAPKTSVTVQKLDPSAIRYVAVGDSYTVGTGVDSTQAWPYLLTEDLRAHGIDIGLAANLGVNGITAQGATDNELATFASAKPTFATLMIGANDTYKLTTPDQFRAQVGLLMDDMLKVLPRKGRLLVVTIPDFSATPMGKLYSGMNNAGAKIGEFNTILGQEAAKRHLPIVNITPISRGMATDASLIVWDGVHPSPKEYILWEKLIYSKAYPMFAGKTAK